MHVSIVIPVRNEAENLRELGARVSRVCDALAWTYEIVFVTDINTDDTVQVLRTLHHDNPRVKMLKLSNAFGHHVAVYAGLQHVGGDIVVIMDGDLQDHPEDIPKLYAKLQEGYDIVYGTKACKNESVLRNLFSRLFVAVLRWLSDYRMDFNTCMFRMVSRRVVDAVLQFKEREPSLTFIMGMIGFPTASVEVTSGVREHGQTNYSFLRQINLAISSIVSFSTKPLRIISLFGLAMAGLSLMYFVVIIVQWCVFGIPVAGWATIIGMLSLIGGILLFAQGMTGEYIARIFMETKHRPLYLVEEQLGLDCHNGHETG